MNGVGSPELVRRKTSVDGMQHEMLIWRTCRVVVESLDEAVGAPQRDVVEARDGQAETLVRGCDEAFLCVTE